MKTILIGFSFVLASFVQAQSGYYYPMVHVCDRTEEIKQALMEYANKTDCNDVSLQDLTSIKYMDLADKGISSLKIGDFSGLINMRVLSLRDNKIKTLPKGFLQTLPPIVRKGSFELDIRFNQLSERERDRIGEFMLSIGGKYTRWDRAELYESP